MTNKDKTLIAALLDRSGSMASCRKATEDGFNELVKDQKGQPGECIMTLAQFDVSGGFVGLGEEQQIPEWVYENLPIAEVPNLDLQPRGGTPLLDAMGNFITRVGEKLAALPEDERPGTVVILVMTDGQENSSREWTRDGVKDLVTQQEDQYNWKFVFLGANIDAIGEGVSLGVGAASSANFNSFSSTATRNAYAATSMNLSSLRAGTVSDISYSAAQRKSMMEEEDVD